MIKKSKWVTRDVLALDNAFCRYSHVTFCRYSHVTFCRYSHVTGSSVRLYYHFSTRYCQYVWEGTNHEENSWICIPFCKYFDVTRVSSVRQFFQRSTASIIEKVTLVRRDIEIVYQCLTWTLHIIFTLFPSMCSFSLDWLISQVYIYNVVVFLPMLLHV